MADIKSPCVNVCALGDHGFCIGCFRSADEIAGWYRMTFQEKREVVNRLDVRAVDLGAALSGPVYEGSSD